MTPFNRRTAYLPATMDWAVPKFAHSGGYHPTLVLDNAHRHLIHADLTADYLLLIQRAEQWHICALIDWANTEVGTTEYEWVTCLWPA